MVGDDVRPGRVVGVERAGHADPGDGSGIHRGGRRGELPRSARLRHDGLADGPVKLRRILREGGYAWW
jgi:hypothetical protein